MRLNNFIPVVKAALAASELLNSHSNTICDIAALILQSTINLWTIYNNILLFISAKLNSIWSRANSIILFCPISVVILKYFFIFHQKVCFHSMFSVSIQVIMNRSAFPSISNQLNALSNSFEYCRGFVVYRTLQCDLNRIQGKVLMRQLTLVWPLWDRNTSNTIRAKPDAPPSHTTMANYWRQPIYCWKTLFIHRTIVWHDKIWRK